MKTFQFFGLFFLSKVIQATGGFLVYDFTEYSVVRRIMKMLVQFLLSFFILLKNIILLITKYSPMVIRFQAIWLVR